jgi:CRISPR-associated protein Cas2
MGKMTPSAPSPARTPGGDDRLYIVAYDISEPKRWRKLFKLMNGYGEWLQLSVFQCRLDRRRLVELRAGVEEVIRRGHDHVLIIDLGPAESVAPKVTSLGKAFTGIERSPVIV